MSSFKECVAADNDVVFLNMEEFADTHNLNGTTCKAICQDISISKELSTGGGVSQTYPGIYGSHLMVNCIEKDLPEIPVEGSAFTVDDHLYLVERAAEDVGIVTIILVANDR